MGEYNNTGTTRMVLFVMECFVPCTRRSLGVLFGLDWMCFLGERQDRGMGIELMTRDSLTDQAEQANV